MKKTDTSKEFYFKNSKQELVDSLNKELPINIKNLEYLIDRIHTKYPIITKSEVSLIVRSTFEAIRDFLILGYIINFNKFIIDMKLYFFQHVINNTFNTAVKVKIKTPAKMK